MCIEVFPGSKIVFPELFDARLKRFGVGAKTSGSGSTGALIAPDGTAMIVRKSGCAEVSGKMPLAVRDAVAREFHLVRDRKRLRKHEASEPSPVEQESTTTLAPEMSHG
jgi:hypothetical protein